MTNLKTIAELKCKVPTNVLTDAFAFAADHMQPGVATRICTANYFTGSMWIEALVDVDRLWEDDGPLGLTQWVLVNGGIPKAVRLSINRDPTRIVRLHSSIPLNVECALGTLNKAERLDLSTCKINVNSLMALATLCARRTLKYLRLSMAQMAFVTQAEVFRYLSDVHFVDFGEEIRSSLSLKLKPTKPGCLSFGMTHICSLSRVTVLNMQRTLINNYDLLCLGRLQHLAELRLDQTNISDDGITMMAKSFQCSLRTLDISYTRVRTNFAPLALMADSLRHLGVSGLDLSNISLKNILGMLPELRTVSADCNRRLDNEGMCALGELDMRKVRCLSVMETAVTSGIERNVGLLVAKRRRHGTRGILEVVIDEGILYANPRQRVVKFAKELVRVMK